MKKNDISNLDKVSRARLFDELMKGMKDVEVGNVTSIEEARNAIEERHAAYLRTYTVEARETRSS